MRTHNKVKSKYDQVVQDRINFKLEAKREKQKELLDMHSKDIAGECKI